MSVAALVRRPSYRNLLIGQEVSALGDWMGTVAFMALALEYTGSPTAVGGVLALRLLPAAIGGPLAARAAHLWDRRRIMLTTDAARAVMIAMVPFVRALWWLYLWAFLLEVASLVFLPARDSAIPDLVDEDELPLANGLILGSSYGSIPLGAAAFAAFAALPFASPFDRPYALVFWIDAVTFLVSFAYIATAVGLQGRGSEEETEHLRFRDALQIPLVRAVLPAAGAVALALGALFSLGIVFVRDVLGAGNAEFGWLIALFGVGAVLGVMALQRQSGADPLLMTRSAIVTMGAIVAVFSLSPALWTAYLGAAGFGAAAAFALAAGMGTVQSRLDGQRRLVAFAAFHVVIRIALGLSAIGAGLAGDLLGALDWPLVGRLEPARVILLCSGILVIASAGLVRVRTPAEAA